MGVDWALCSGRATSWLAMHFGNLVAANQSMDTFVDIFINRLLESPSWKQQEAIGVYCQLAIYIPAAAIMLGREKTQLPVYAKLGVNWSTADKFVDETLVPNMYIMRPRGDT